MSKMIGRDTAFAALALLRCRDRLDQLLDTIAEPRRSQLEYALGELRECDESRLKQTLADVIRREDAELKDAVAQRLGSAAPQASRAVLRWIARQVAL